MQLTLSNIDVNIVKVEQNIVYCANILRSSITGGFVTYNKEGVEVAYPWVTRGIVEGRDRDYLGLEMYFPLVKDYLSSKRYPHLQIDDIPLRDGVPIFPDAFKNSVLNA